MKLVLENYPLKLATNLKDVGVVANGNNYPAYTEQVVDGRFEYADTFIPEYIAHGVLYDVTGYSGAQELIRGYKNTKTSYDPLDLQVAYLSGSVLPEMPSFDVSFFNYWYKQAVVYSSPTVYRAISANDLFGEFSNSVGAIALYTPTPESVAPTSLNSANVKPYNRVIEANILDDLRDEIDQAVKDVNSPYSANIANVASGSSSTTPHGGKLVVDTSNNTRYQSASSTYQSNLVSEYAQLMYLSPLYAYQTQGVELSAAPYFNATIEGVSVVVDNLNNKVNTVNGWMETVMLSSYPE